MLGHTNYLPKVSQKATGLSSGGRTIPLNFRRKGAKLGCGSARPNGAVVGQTIRAMTIHATVRFGIQRSRWCCRGLSAVAVVAVLIGCVSTETAWKEPTPRQDFIEYRRIVVQAMSQIEAVLHALDEVCVQANRDPRPAYQAFAKAVHRLEVDSIKVRARTQAMRARGDAYFEHWEAYLAGVENTQVRTLAEQRRPELKRSFEQAQSASQQVRAAFRPFLSDLQKLRAILEADPSLARIDSAKELILAAKDKGRDVLQGLDRVLAEMNAMTALLRPPRTSSTH